MADRDDALAVFSASKRRMLRRLRCHWRHEQFSLRMPLATAMHHRHKGAASVGTQSVNECVTPAPVVTPAPAVIYAEEIASAPASTCQYLRGAGSGCPCFLHPWSRTPHLRTLWGRSDGTSAERILAQFVERIKVVLLAAKSQELIVEVVKATPALSCTAPAPVVESCAPQAPEVECVGPAPNEALAASYAAQASRINTS